MSEHLYDKEIAPKLMEIAKLCQQHGMGFVAACEYKPGEVGTTSAPLVKHASASMRVASMGVRCNGNVDALIMAIERDAKKFGHSSAYLTILEYNRKETGVNHNVHQNKNAH